MKLRVKVPGVPERDFDLKKGVNILGRAKESDIPIIHSGVSRRHLQFDVEDNKVYVTELGSSNGTKMGEKDLVAGQRLELTTFFPLVLAKDIEISLQTDHGLHQEMMGQGPIEIREDLRTINTQTKKIGPKRLELMTEKKESKFTVLLQLLALLVLIFVAIYLLKPEWLGM